MHDAALESCENRVKMVRTFENAFVGVIPLPLLRRCLPDPCNDRTVSGFCNGLGLLMT
jgi:hypothetical protein